MGRFPGKASSNPIMSQEFERRRTFAIISHPDAGKTTLTEKLLLFGGAIQLAGTVKGRKSARHATSDWMAMEKERGISVTSSVMQFPFDGYLVNLLDTPGHADFSEDTYRTLTAVDSAMMVIDCAKGVEERTIKLMEVCRLRDTPIYTFINKLDREGRDPMELMDEVERVLGIQCTPVTWPIGMGKQLKGIYHLLEDRIYIYEEAKGGARGVHRTIDGLRSDEARAFLGDDADDYADEVELVREATPDFDLDAYRGGRLTPVFFGSAISNFGVQELLESFVRTAPPPQPAQTTVREVRPEEKQLTGFVFKVQANMDPAHRDRVAFLRICSGCFRPGMKLRHVRQEKNVKISQALTFMASDREHTEEAWAGDIIGLHNHGTIRIGDTFTEGEQLQFTGIPNFAPDLFRRAVLTDPLRMKQLQKGLDQLCEEGATQLFRPLRNNDLILGAVGQLQFDVVAERLRTEYGVECKFEPVNVATARWTYSDDDRELDRFRRRAEENLAIDHSGALVYIAPTRVNLDLAMERNPEIEFRSTRDHLAA